MKTLLLGINSKYIHTNLAIRLLHKNTSYDTFIYEITIKDDINELYKYIKSNDYDNIAISTYIWNIEVVTKLLKLLENDNYTIILGGPEASYNTEHLFSNYKIDYIIKGEGEIAFDKLLHALEQGTDTSSISNLSSKILNNPILEIFDLDVIDFAYDINDDFVNKIQYIETSRGCPFSCSFCMSSLEKRVRYFNIDKIKATILMFKNKNAKTIKFLDRTFNTNKKYAIEIMDFIIQNHNNGQVYQFEITGDILDSEIIDYLVGNAPKGLFRFEIGIQSTNFETNILVDRVQNNEKLFANILKIQNSNIIDLHLDLIAGLPKESLESFKNTFNEVMSLTPKELQLGFLKMLHGTKIRLESDKYGYTFNQVAPYEITSNDSLSNGDLKVIKYVEETLEIYWNKSFMNNTIMYIFKTLNNDYFDILYNFGVYLDSIDGFKKYQVDELFINVYNFFKNLVNNEKLLYLLKKDYLKRSKVKPKIWWDKSSKLRRNELINYVSNRLCFSVNLLFKYSIVEEYNNEIFIAIYKDGAVTTYELI